MAGAEQKGGKGDGSQQARGGRLFPCQPEEQKAPKKKFPAEHVSKKSEPEGQRCWAERVSDRLVIVTEVRAQRRPLTDQCHPESAEGDSEETEAPFSDYQPAIAKVFAHCQRHPRGQNEPAKETPKTPTEPMGMGRDGRKIASEGGEDGGESDEGVMGNSSHPLRHP